MKALSITRADIEALEKKAEEAFMPRPFVLKIAPATWLLLDDHALAYVIREEKQGRLQTELCDNVPPNNFYLQPANPELDTLLIHTVSKKANPYKFSEAEQISEIINELEKWGLGDRWCKNVQASRLVKAQASLDILVYEERKKEKGE